MIAHYKDQKKKLNLSKNRHIVAFIIFLILAAFLFCISIYVYTNMVENNYKEITKYANEQHDKQYSEYSEAEVGYALNAAEAENQWIHNFFSFLISGISIFFSVIGSTILVQIYNLKRSMRVYEDKIKYLELEKLNTST